MFLLQSPGGESSSDCKAIKTPSLSLANDIIQEAGAGNDITTRDIGDNYAAIGADDIATVYIDHNAPILCDGYIGKVIRWPRDHNIAF